MSATQWKECAFAKPSTSGLRYLAKPRVCALFTTAFSVLAEKANKRKMKARSAEKRVHSSKNLGGESLVTAISAAGAN